MSDPNAPTDNTTPRSRKWLAAILRDLADEVEGVERPARADGDWLAELTADGTSAGIALRLDEVALRAIDAGYPCHNTERRLTTAEGRLVHARDLCNSAADQLAGEERRAADAAAQAVMHAVYLIGKRTNITLPPE